MTVIPILYSDLIYESYKSLLNSNLVKIIKDENNKYRLEAFRDRLFCKHIENYMFIKLASLNASNKQKIIVFDTCSPLENELNDIYLQKLSKRKQKLIFDKIDIKYYLKERYIKIPEEKFNKLFNNIFNKWFKKSPIENVYFVRYKSISAIEAYNQAKTILKSAMSNLSCSYTGKKIVDINEFLYSRLSNVCYEQHEDFRQYILKLVFPYV